MCNLCFTIDEFCFVQPTSNQCQNRIYSSCTNGRSIFTSAYSIWFCQDPTTNSRHRWFRFPYQHIAADVTNNNNINLLDLTKMRRISLGIIEGQPTYDAWKYLDATVEFSDPNNPFLDIDESSYQVNTLLTEDQEINFIGIKMGDINTN